MRSKHAGRALHLVSLLPLYAALLAPVAASAAGFELPDNGARALARGGAFTARADDPSAVALNPGALSKLKGGHFLYSHNLMWSQIRFTREPTGIPSRVDYGVDPLAPVENEAGVFPMGVMLAATHDFGLEHFTFGLSVYGPNAVGQLEFPVTGGQRYLLTSLDTAVVYTGLSAAWGNEVAGIGVTAQWAQLPWLRYGLVVDGQPGGELNPYASGSDVEAIIELSDSFAPTLLAGAWWRPMPQIEFGVAGRLVPITFDSEGDMTLNNVPGQTAFTDEQLKISDSSAALEFSLPATARFGLRYRHLAGEREVFDIELDLVYEAWSRLRAFDMDLEGGIMLFANEPTQDVSVPKQWQDSLSVRLGSTVQVLPERLALSVGGYWEQGTTPHNYTHLDFMSLDRYGLGGGVHYTQPIGDTLSIDLSVAYSHVFQQDRHLREGCAKVMQLRPVGSCPDECQGYDGVPANAGTFESSFDQLNVALAVRY